MVGWGNEKSRVESKDILEKKRNRLFDPGEAEEFNDSQIHADPLFGGW